MITLACEMCGNPANSHIVEASIVAGSILAVGLAAIFFGRTRKA